MTGGVAHLWRRFVTLTVGSIKQHIPSVTYSAQPRPATTKPNPRPAHRDGSPRKSDTFDGGTAGILTARHGQGALGGGRGVVTLLYPPRRVG